MSGLFNAIRPKTLAALTCAGAVCSIALAAPAAASDDATTTTPVTVSTTQARSDAISWTEQQMGSTYWDGRCLQLVADAYTNAGINISAQADDTTGAAQFWNSTHDAKYSDSASSPSGALIFWAATDTNPYGHVAISLGNGQAISSDERDNPGVHIFSITARDAAGYQDLGYVLPD